MNTIKPCIKCGSVNLTITIHGTTPYDSKWAECKDCHHNEPLEAWSAPRPLAEAMSEQIGLLQEIIQGLDKKIYAGARYIVQLGCNECPRFYDLCGGKEGAPDENCVKRVVEFMGFSL